LCQPAELACLLLIGRLSWPSANYAAGIIFFVRHESYAKKLVFATMVGEQERRSAPESSEDPNCTILTHLEPAFPEALWND